jgi:hypothetical protein
MDCVTSIDPFTSNVIGIVETSRVRGSRARNVNGFRGFAIVEPNKWVHHVDSGSLLMECCTLLVEARSGGPGRRIRIHCPRLACISSHFFCWVASRRARICASVLL